MRLSDPEYNRLTVLKKLRSAEPVSRTELARLSGLTGGSITPIVGDLVRRGLVLEEKAPQPVRGRPRINLRINPEGAYVVAANLGSNDGIRVEIVNLTGQSVFGYTAPLAPTQILAELADQIAALLVKVIASSPIDAAQIYQIGIGLPAIVDNRAGVVRHLETFDPGPFDFARVVERQVGIPVRIDNNINLLARAEHWFGDGSVVDDFTLIMLDLGVGAARYEGGQLVVGSHGIEAELGHIKMIPDGGRLCHCGARGCLQTYSSMSGVIQQYCELTDQIAPPHQAMYERFLDIAALAKEGDEDCRALFHRAGRYLGIAVANHINVQDPDRIIILAGATAMIDEISTAFTGALHEATLESLREADRVTFKPHDDQNYARGAAAMVLEQLYQTQ